MTNPSTAARPPGPSGQPLLGCARPAGRDLLGFVTENARTYGDVVHFEIVGEPFYQLTHPDHVETVLVERNEQFGKGRLTREILAPVVGRGLFTSEGETWRTQRRRIEPSFHPDQIEDYGDVVVDRTEALCREWTDGDRIDVHDAMLGLTLEIVADALLGVDVRSDVRTIGRSLDVILGYIESTPNLLLPDWAPTPGKRRYRRAIGDLEAVVESIVAERRSESGGTDVVSRLLQAETDDGESMSDDQLRDEVMTFMIAGHETTAAALTYTCYLLATHPRVEARLVEELDETLGGESPTVADVADLDVLDRVLTESLRLYPPANRINRAPTEDVVIGGHEIPAGGMVVLPQWVVHRDPRWYDDPLAFDPERWTEEGGQDRPRFAYFPFGAGPRRCIGDRFARMEATLALATLLQQCHLERRPETSLEVEAAVTTRPEDPVWMTVRDR